MKRHRSSGDEVTLFPFLAVLICTMGALIVLLVVIVQQAKVNGTEFAKQRAEQAASDESAAEGLSKEVDELRWRQDVVNASRTQSAEELERERSALSYLEDEIRQLQDRIRREADEAEHIAQLQQSHAAEAGGAAESAQALREKIDYAREALAHARDEFKHRQPSYALVPYAGANGTRRRPIFIECRADRIILQPEGIELSSDDFVEPLTDDNPLAAALRAQREYIKDAAGSDEGEAYPLIVVRPDGAMAYSAARAAMHSWETEFGYELVDADMKLAYPPKDPQLLKVVESAVADARQRRELLQSIAPARFGRAAAPRLAASKTGGFVSAPESASRFARPPGTSGHGGGAASGVGPGTGGAVPGRRAGNGAGGMVDVAGAEGEPVGGGQNRAIGGGPGGTQNGTASASGFASAGGFADGDLLAAAGPRGPGAPNATQGNGSSNHAVGRATSTSPTSGTPSNAQAANGAGEQVADARQAAQRGNGSRATGGGSGGTSGSTTGARGTNRSATDHPAADNSTNGAAAYAAPAKGGGAASAGGPSTGGTASAGAGGAGAAGGSAGASSAGQAAGNSASGGGAAGGAGGGGMPTINLNSTAAAPSSARSMAGSRGVNWGLPNGASATGITRPITMACYPDRLVLYPENPVRGRPFDVVLQDSMEDELEALVKRIWKRMDNWGIAGDGMYWRPVLQVEVSADGETRFNELTALLEGSGIGVKRR